MPVGLDRRWYEGRQGLPPWLNPSAGKIVVAPKPWFRAAALDDSRIVPDRWLRLPA